MNTSRTSEATSEVRKAGFSKCYGEGTGVS